MMFKHRNLVRYAFGCVSKYRLRTLVIIIAVLAATTMVSSTLMIKDGLAEEAWLSVVAAPDITVQYQKMGRIVPIPLNVSAQIAGMDGVGRVSARTWGYAGIGSKTFTCVGLNTSELSFVKGVMQEVERGRFLSPSDEGKESVVIGKLVQRELNVDVGDVILMFCEGLNPCQFTVVGIFSDASSIYTADMIVMSITDANVFFLVPQGYATDLMVYIEEGTDPKGVAASFSSIPNLRVIDRDTMIRGYQAAYEAKGGVFITIWMVVLVAVTLIAFSQAIIVGSQSKFETGLLKTFGFSTLDVIEVRLVESALITLFAASTGILIGYVYSAVFNAPGLAGMLLGWSYIPQGFSMPTSIRLETIFSVYSVMVLPVVIATVVPAWINAITDPEISMRRAAT